MDKASVRFLGLPYGKNGPLGEGPDGRYDQDPLYRFDTFDCTTFVETVVGLALSHNVDEFEMQMDRIRYENGEIDYLKRNHFPEHQWIPNNISNGLLSEINDSIMSPRLQKEAVATIDVPGWLKKITADQLVVPNASNEEKLNLVEELHSEAAHYSPVIARMNYLAIDDIVKRPSLLTKIPSGTIVNFVRPNWDLTETAGTHLNVSHQALLFRKGKLLIIRHASTTGEVMELPFLDYLKKWVGHPTLKGIHLLRVNVQSEANFINL
jgi:hypothetical protein